MNLFLICSLIILFIMFSFLSFVWREKQNKHVFLPSFAITLTIMLYQFVGSSSPNSMKIVTSSNQALLAENLINDINSSSTMPIDEMIAGLEKKLLNEKNNTDGWILLARSYYNQKNYKKSIFAYQKALDLIPNEPDLIANLADAMIMQKDGFIDNEVKNLLEKSIALNPDHRKTLALLATSSMYEENPREAIQYWTKLENTLEKDSEDAAKIKEIIKNLLVAINAGSTNSTYNKKFTGEVSLSSDALKYFNKNPTSSKSVIFIIARDLSGNNMPVAVSKINLSIHSTLLDKNKAIKFQISDSDSITKKRILSQFDSFHLHARLSYEGSVIPKIGDLFGDEILIKKGMGKINLSLSKVKGIDND